MLKLWSSLNSSEQLERTKLEAEEEFAETCTFAPTIDARSAQLVEVARRHRDEGIDMTDPVSAMPCIVLRSPMYMLTAPHVGIFGGMH